MTNQEQIAKLWAEMAVHKAQREARQEAEAKFAEEHDAQWPEFKRTYTYKKSGAL